MDIARWLRGNSVFFFRHCLGLTNNISISIESLPGVLSTKEGELPFLSLKLELHKRQVIQGHQNWKNPKNDFFVQAVRLF